MSSLQVMMYIGAILLFAVGVNELRSSIVDAIDRNTAAIERSAK